MVQSRTGYLGTNVPWAQPTWDRQAGLPALMYTLPSLACCLSSQCSCWLMCCFEVHTKSTSPGALGSDTFPSGELTSAGTREGTCCMLKASAHSRSTPECLPSSLGKHLSIVTWPTPCCVVPVQREFQAACAFKKAKCCRCSWKHLILAELKLDSGNSPFAERFMG